QQGRFLTEFRPTVALFLRFVGLDYDDDGIEATLDGIVSQVQAIVARYDGTLLHLTIGDKGSYATIAFGALATHEDDMRRAARAALDIRAAAGAFPGLAPVQIGLTYGVARVGAYGSATRRTYSVLGDEVNRAARLMQAAAPGEILISERVRQALAQTMVTDERAPMTLKGQHGPQTVHALVSMRAQPGLRLHEPAYALPMVGRAAELALLREALEQARMGRGQAVGITAEAGLGKSRLVAETIAMAREQGFAGFGGACQSDSVISPYAVWKEIWAAFFALDHAAPLPERRASLAQQLLADAPDRADTLPLLGALLDVPIAETDFTRGLEPKVRQSALHATLEACLKARSQAAPVLLVIEDMHWIDALSATLLHELMRATTALPICFLLAYRELPARLAAQIAQIGHFRTIPLRELSHDEARAAVRAKLGQLYPASAAPLPASFAEPLLERAQGNPFYLEELINYLHDRGLDPAAAGAIAPLDLPDSLHALILSRIDQLAEREKTTLRVASIIGRRFPAAWLPQYYPGLGAPAQISKDLAMLERLDLTPLETPEPELAYIFKHIVTHEVAYHSLPYATRAQLHEQMARFLESLPDAGAGLLDNLAYHYGRSDNQAKQREYFLKAGDAARARYANDAALDYYAQALPLLADPADQADAQLRRGAVYEMQGRHEEASAAYQAALDCLPAEPLHAARCQMALGHLAQVRGEYAAAQTCLDLAEQGWTTPPHPAGLAQIATERAYVAWRQGDAAAGQRHAEDGLALARQVGEPAGISKALNGLGIVRWSQQDYAGAQAQYEESLALRRAMGDRWGMGLALGNLGIVLRNQGRYAAAQAAYEESLALCEAMGDKPGLASVFNGLGTVAFVQENYRLARDYFAASLALFREMDSAWEVAMLLNNLGEMAERLADTEGARAFHQESLEKRRALGDRVGIAQSLANLANVAAESDSAAEIHARYAESLALFQEAGHVQGILYNLVGLMGRAALAGAYRRVAALGGAADALLAASQIQLEPAARQSYDDHLAAARAAMEADAFSAAWAAGRALSREEAIALASHAALPA
ncbi:MAG TPA: tetratricopeptide repeat protein, partial [Herpetosiphonaceae bacterium]